MQTFISTRMPITANYKSSQRFALLTITQPAIVNIQLGYSVLWSIAALVFNYNFLYLFIICDLYTGQCQALLINFLKILLILIK